MLGVPVLIVRYVSDDVPGWVECRLTDAHGRTWPFIEKVPVVTDEDLDASSTYPRPGVIACEVVTRGGLTAVIDTARPWGIESTDGATRFEIPAGSLVDVDLWPPPR